MRINHNIGALNTYRQLTTNTASQGKSIEKLSSGLRINRAGDDAAGLAISEKMRGQIRGLDQASRNAQDGISLIQTAEGALNETHSILQRMRELSVQASNDTSTDSDRKEIQKEITQLTSEIDRIANTTEFNTKKLLNGDLQAQKVAQGTKLESVGVSAKAAITGAALTQDSYQIDTTNNTLKVSDGTSDFTVTLTAGSYTGASLATEIQTQIIAANAAAFADVTIAWAGNQFSIDNDGATGTATNITLKMGGTANQTLGITAQQTENHTNGAAAATNFTSTSAYNAVALNVGGTNNTIDISVNGAALETINIGTAGQNYTGANLAKSINAAIQANANLKGKVEAVYDSAADKITFNNLTDEQGANSTLRIAQNGVDTGNSTVGFGALTATYDGSNLLLTGLKDADGNNFGLTVGDVVKINSKIDGKAQAEASYTITATSTLTDLTNQIATQLGLNATDVTITDDGKVQIVGANGEDNAVSDVTLSVTDRTRFNNKFSNFSETQAAQDASVNNALTYQIGSNQGQSVEVDINRTDVQALSLDSVDVSTQQGAQNSITVVDNALTAVSAERSKLGAYQNRLEHTINNLNTSSENLTAAESRIRDVDMAKEISEQTKSSILAQAAQAMLAQANQQPQGVLQLLR